MRTDVTHAFLLRKQNCLKLQGLRKSAAAIFSQNAGEGIVGMVVGRVNADRSDTHPTVFMGCEELGVGAEPGCIKDILRKGVKVGKGPITAGTIQRCGAVDLIQFVLVLVGRTRFSQRKEAEPLPMHALHQIVEMETRRSL